MPTGSDHPIAFAGSPLDRADHLRSDPDALAGVMNWRARLLHLDGLGPVLSDEGGLSWGSLAEAGDDAELVFLGLIEDRAHFAAVPPIEATGVSFDPRVWQVMHMLSPPDLATYGAARCLVDWHARHRFCARCGSATAIAKGGWQRNCTACGGEHFPRTDPVTIMLVEHGGKLLLGRQPRFPPRAFSALAGFVEPGETVEEAVAREVFEEVGIRARDVRYVASQPWPFPSQLMIGCHCMAEGTDIVLDETELDEARWFTREDIALALSEGRDTPNPQAPFAAPPPAAIANTLLRWWMEREA